MVNVQKFTATGTKKQIYPWFNTIADLDGEARMNITDTGIYLTSVDSANVAMLIVHISPEQFETYKTTGDDENPLVLGINFTRYTNIMKKRHLKQTSQFSFEVLPPQKIPTAGMLESGDLFSAYLPRILFGVDDIFFEYSTLSPASIRKKPKVPKLDLPIELGISLDELCNMLYALGSAGIDHMRIEVDSTDVNNPEFIMRGETDESERVSKSIPLCDLPYHKIIPIEFDSAPPDRLISSFHSTDYLNSMVSCLKAFGGAGEVRMKIGMDMPIIITLDPEGNSKITYILAPRIGSD